MSQCSVIGCSKIAVKRGWCGMHYRRWHRHGTTDLPLIIKVPDKERFWEKVNKNGSIHPICGQCWEWTGCKNQEGNKGYGVFSVNDTSTYVHRYSYELHYGLFSKEMRICHHCDNRICVNPIHLFIGTTQDNTDDKVKKGRQLKGIDIPQAKLTENDVKLIRELRSRGAKVLGPTGLAVMFNVCFQTIYFILSKETWKHVE